MTIRIEPELPWNVAGIAPEAREAARASARREGLSVGEWLTRRILRELGESPARRDDWRSAPARRANSDYAPLSPETADMPAHVSKSESDIHDSARRISEQLKNLARRLEYAERSQYENSRAMTQAASEINIVSREQAQAFDRLGNHVVRLDERLARIEQLSAVDATKQAIKALHLGLSRLADQMAETATHSAAQAAQLAENMGAVVGKLAETREEGRRNWHALEKRVAALAANVGSVAAGLLESRDLAERAFKAVEARLSAAEETMARLGAADTGRATDSAEVRRQASALARLSGSVDALTHRFAALEVAVSQHSDRHDASIESMEARLADSALGGRLDAAEQRFDGELRTLAARVDAVSQRQKDAVAEIGTLVKELSGRVDASRAPPADSATRDGASRFGLPPFDETPPNPAQAANPHPTGASLESFFASRNGGSSARNSSPQFSWNDPAAGRSTGKGKIWIVLLAVLAGLISAAIAAGAILSRIPAAPPAAPVAIHRIPSAPPRPSKQTHPPKSARVSASVQPTQRTTEAKPAAPQDRLAALASLGNAKAETLLGIDDVEGRGRPANAAEGAKWLARAARKGEAVAAWRLGSMYEHGQGVPADAAKSVGWYKVAAEAGNRKAMHNLAVAYANGSGATKDLAQAAHWFAQAAALGLVDSQYNLAVLYERGLGVPQNLRAAYTWYAIAAAQGDQGSQARLAALASQISAADKSAAEKSAAEFRPEALNAAADSPPRISGTAGDSSLHSQTP